VNRLRELIPQLTITIRAALPEAQLRRRMHHLDTLQHATDDFGMVMEHAFNVDTRASLARYQSLHQDWDHKVNALAQQFMDTHVDVVLADVPYLPLAAAQVAGIPAVALCSLNWADILSHYVELDLQQTTASAVGSPQTEYARIDLPHTSAASNHSQAIIHTMYGAYQSARYFLQPAPSMAMPKLNNQRAIGPCCAPGVAQRQTLLSTVQQQKNLNNPWLVLVGMGGIPFELSLEHWPTQHQGRPLCYVVSPASANTHPNALSDEATGLSYSNLVASVDLIITKPGYGMFAEAAAAGLPVLFTDRGDWPETEALVTWLQGQAHCAQITTDALRAGTFEQELSQLLAQGPYTPVAPTGNDEAAALIAALFTHN
jgi:UDP:flavonoid glycosyltransferase YjiC (YdhE family)